jgi:hypothetical protein
VAGVHQVRSSRQSVLAHLGIGSFLWSGQARAGRIGSEGGSSVDNRTYPQACGRLIATTSAGLILVASGALHDGVGFCHDSLLVRYIADVIDTGPSNDPSLRGKRTGECY